MLQWETVDESAIYPFERYKALSDKRECRIFYDPDEAAIQELPWILVVREVGEDDLYWHVYHGNYGTVDEAKGDAEEWVAPPPR